MFQTISMGLLNLSFAIYLCFYVVSPGEIFLFILGIVLTNNV